MVFKLFIRYNFAKKPTLAVKIGNLPNHFYARHAHYPLLQEHLRPCFACNEYLFIDFLLNNYILYFIIFHFFHLQSLKYFTRKHYR